MKFLIMQEISSWSELFINSLQTFGQKLMGAAPSIIGAILILLLGWLMSRLFASIARQLLRLIKLDQLAERIKATDMLAKANIKTKPTDLIAKFVYWVLMLLVIVTASDTLGWHAVSQEIARFINYLPNLLAGILFFIVGVYLATFVRDVIQGATGSLGISIGKLVGTIVFYILVIIVSLTSLQQAGIDTSIINANLLIIIGTIFAAAAISYGIDYKEILENILASFFGKKSFKVGQIIEFDGLKGKILEINNINIVLEKNAEERIVVPAKKLISTEVTISSATPDNTSQ
jgi:small-conductance mechanosensitive channel